jgi:hypothetical protein
MIKSRIWKACLPAFLILSSVTSAQDYSADLSDVTVKFVRNMKLIEARTPEPEIKEMIQVVYLQAQEVAGFFREGNADTLRRKIRKYEEELKMNPDIDDRHRRDLKEMKADLKDKDEEGDYQAAAQRYRTSSSELIKALNLIQTSDENRAQLIRITIEHVRKYQTALSIFPN